MQPLQAQERYYTALANFLNAASRDQGKLDLQILDLAVGLHVQSMFLWQALGQILQEAGSIAPLSGQERYQTAVANLLNGSTREPGRTDLRIVDIGVGLHVQSEFLWQALSSLLEQVRRLRASVGTSRR
jgi:hypothetical protein